MKPRAQILLAAAALVVVSATTAVAQMLNPAQLREITGPDVVLVGTGSCTIETAGKPSVTGFAYSLRKKAAAQVPCTTESVTLCSEQTGIYRFGDKACPATVFVPTSETNPPRFELFSGGACKLANGAPASRYVVQAYRYQALPCQAAEMKLCPGVTISTPSNRVMCAMTAAEIAARAKEAQLDALRAAIASYRTSNPEEPPLYAFVIVEQREPITLVFPDGTKVLLDDGAGITFDGDLALPKETVVETSNDGAANILFPDNANLVMSEGTRLRFDEFIYDPEAGDGSTFFSFLQGVFVYTSGLIGKKEPQEVHIETPVAGVGIRGTRFEARINPDKSGTIKQLEGEIVYTPKSGGPGVILKAGELLTFDQTGKPSTPSRF